METLGSMDKRQDKDEINQNSKTIPKLIANADSTQYKVII